MIHVCNITHTDTHKHHHTITYKIINKNNKSKETSSNQIKSNQIKSNQIKSNQIKYDDNDNDKYYHIKSITLMKYHTERYCREI